MRTSNVCFYSFAVDIHYGFGFDLPLLFHKDEAFRALLSVAKVPMYIPSAKPLSLKSPFSFCRSKLLLYSQALSCRSSLKYAQRYAFIAMEVIRDLFRWANDKGVRLNGIEPRRIPGRGIGVVATRRLKVTNLTNPTIC